MSTLASEVIVKLRAILDYAAYDVYEAKVKSKRGGIAHEPIVYFPITDSLQKFEAAMKRYKLDDLQTDALQTFIAFQNAQPFKSNPENLWLWDLNELSRVARHRYPVLQVKKVIRAATIVDLDAPIISGVEVSFNYGQFTVITHPLDQNNALYLVWFEFANTTSNALRFLTEATDKVEALVTEVLACI